MREILFCGKRVDTGGWVEGNLFIPDRADAPTEICIGTNIVRTSFDVIPETVGQYTGLTDKNDAKIFEGDIILYDDDVGCVEYDIADACFYLSFHTWATDFACVDSLDVEVIGNIHDNPELLKGGAK